MRQERYRIRERRNLNILEATRHGNRLVLKRSAYFMRRDAKIRIRFLTIRRVKRYLVKNTKHRNRRKGSDG